MKFTLPWLRKCIWVLLSICFMAAANVVITDKPTKSNLEETVDPNKGGEEGTAGEEGASGEEGEEASVPSSTIAIAVMCIISVIVLMTVIFEIAKDAIIELANAHVKPVVQQMFQELTILGFLSLFVFLMSVTNILTHISGTIFGETEEGEHYLGELVEITHYLIFLIMGINIFQVFLLVS